MKRFFNIAAHFFVSTFIVFALQIKWQGKSLEEHIIKHTLVEAMSKQIQPVAKKLSSFVKKNKKKF